MSKEIYPNELYELLNELNNKEHYIEDYGYKYKRISLDDTQMLMLYIKHLENKNKETAEISNKFDKIFGMNITQEESFEFTIEESKQILDYITNLQQENEKLNNLFEYNMQTLVNTDKLYEDYKSRCEKAIEYIKEHIRIDDEYPDYMEMLIEERDNLLNILQNGSEDNER